MAVASVIRKFKTYILTGRLLESFCTLVVLIAVIYEFPASAIAEITAANGIFNHSNFIQYRLYFEAVVIATCALNILVNHRYLFKDVYLWLYAMLLMGIVFIVMINREQLGLLNPTDEFLVTAPDFWAPLIYKYILFFLIGFFLFKLRGYKYHIGVVTVASMAIILNYVDFEALSIDRTAFIDKGYNGIYLFLGDATAIASLLIIAFSRSNPARIAFSIIAFVLIFLIGSRTSVAVFGATCFIYFIITLKPKYLGISLIALFSLATYIQTLDLDDLATRNERMFGIFISYEEDGSVQGREALSEIGWADISENLIFGKFGGQVDGSRSGLWRAYMHNIASYWRQFGVIGFLIIILFGVQFAHLLWKYRKKRSTVAYGLCLLLGTFIAIETTFSRSFAFTHSHLFFGLVLASRTLFASRERNSRYLNPHKASLYDEKSPRLRPRKRSRKKSYRF